MTKKKNQSREVCNGDALALAAGTAAASILANIAQAMTGADLKKKTAVLRRERERLMNVLGQWQAEYNDLRIKSDSQEIELVAARKMVVDLERQVRALRRRNLELERKAAESRKGKEE